MAGGFVLDRSVLECARATQFHSWGAKQRFITGSSDTGNPLSSPLLPVSASPVLSRSPSLIFAFCFCLQTRGFPLVIPAYETRHSALVIRHSTSNDCNSTGTSGPVNT
jgi:hypothetical protein